MRFTILTTLLLAVTTKAFLLRGNEKEQKEDDAAARNLQGTVQVQDPCFTGVTDTADVWQISSQELETMTGCGSQVRSIDDVKCLKNSAGQNIAFSAPRGTGMATTCTTRGDCATGTISAEECFIFQGIGSQCLLYEQLEVPDYAVMRVCV